MRSGAQGQIAYASSGPYSAVHLPMEMLAAAAGIQLNHVPYSGGGPAIAAVLAGTVATTASVPSVMAPQIRSGVMRPLISTGAKRVALLPDVPTPQEVGLAGVEFYLWVGIFTQTAVPAPIQAKWRQGVAAALKDPDMQRALEGAGMVTAHMEGQVFLEFLAADARAGGCGGGGAVGRVEYPSTRSVFSQVKVPFSASGVRPKWP